jgi:hypothetical protein
MRVEPDKCCVAILRRGRRGELGCKPIPDTENLDAGLHSEARELRYHDIDAPGDHATTVDVQK